VLRICHNYSQNIYEMPAGETEAARQLKVSQLEEEISRMSDLMVSSRASLRDYLLTA